MVSENDLAAGTIYPPLANIRKVSLAIAVAVAEKAWQQGLARTEKPADAEAMISSLMYDPNY
jgi:malate dehydrogenase (oxaloacetate-decarboxylating)(NADP+)